MRSSLLFATVLLVSCATAGPFAPGTWQSANGFLSVESSRLVWFDPAHNDLSVSAILQRGDDLVTRHRGRIEHVHLTTRGDELDVTIGGSTTTYHRIAEAPPAMSLTPLPLPSPSPLPAETVDSIRGEIEKRNAEDQRLLKARAPQAEIQAAEDANDAWLRETTGRYGWIDAERFGGKAAGAAMVMAKHSADMRLILGALPMMERDLANDKKFAQTFAIAYDQLLLSLGKQQRYGSQVCSESGQHPFLCSVETPSRIDERRAAIGLGPLNEYLTLVSKMLYKGESVRIPTDKELQ